MESEGNYRLIDSTFKNEQRFLPARMTERLVKTVALAKNTGSVHGPS